MISFDSVSATDLSKLGLCKASVRVRPGAYRGERSQSQYRGDVEHARFSRSMSRRFEGR